MKSDDQKIEELTGYLNLIVRAFLVAGKQGAPAEGLLPFNPLYFNILRVLGAHKSARPSFIAEFLSVPRTTISSATKTLKSKGLIVTEADETDGRALSLALSQNGKEVLEAILRQDRRNAMAMLSALDPAEQDAFLDQVGRVARQVVGQDDQSKP